MDRYRRAALLPLGMALVCLSGCKGSLAPRWEEAPWEQELRVHAERPFLGVVVRADQAGLLVERVLKSGPAEAAGVRPGDVLVRVGATRVRTLAELETLLEREGAEQAWQDRVASWRSGRKGEDKNRRLLAQIGMDPGPLSTPRLDFELTVLRGRPGGEDEVVIPAQLRCAEEYRLTTQELLTRSAATHQGGFWIPFVIDLTFQEIPPEEWLLYRGRRVTEPVEVYNEIDLIPALLVSLFRWESCPIDDQRRVTVGHWPAQVTFRGDGGEYVRSILEPGEADRAIY